MPNGPVDHDKQHPDLVKVVWRYERFHHEVDYSGFTNQLIYRPDFVPPVEAVDNYNMELRRV